MWYEYVVVLIPEGQLQVLASPDLHPLVVEPQLSEPLLVDAEQATCNPY